MTDPRQAPTVTTTRPDWSALWAQTLDEGGDWCGPWALTQAEVRAATEWVRYNVPGWLLGYRTDNNGHKWLTALPRPVAGKKGE